ncbi:Phox homologous domain [Phytophthora cinnamomi]|uniref:Phox homologous domain n=1 Tax=Phytophthora cinnamomi TaxID=4785 RepID=UPI00355A7E0A|nr:Phox homologous domain [Phytophthora cinnamomi]
MSRLVCSQACNCICVYAKVRRRLLLPANILLSLRFPVKCSVFKFLHAATRAMIFCTTDYHSGSPRISTANLAPLSPMSPPAVVAQSGEVLEATIAPPLPEPLQRLNPIAHRRWRANTSVEFLTNVKHIDIINSRTTEDRAVLYELEVHLKRPSSRLPTTNGLVFVVVRSFSDFSELRDGVKSTVSATPPCTCEYCLELLIYVRFSLTQPRGVVKLFAGTDRCKKTLAQFMEDLIVLGRRRAEKVGSRECEAQLIIPGLLDDFLLGTPKATRQT